MLNNCGADADIISLCVTGESLHPSWEAKRKQKVSVDSFQGKKIKFDD